MSNTTPQHEGSSLSEKYLGRGKGWEYTYTVSGSWPFPTDMLRYDSAQALTENDQFLINALSASPDEYKGDLRRVSVQLVGPRPPTYGRWRSFCWRVE